MSAEADAVCGAGYGMKPVLELLALRVFSYREGAE